MPSVNATPAAATVTVPVNVGEAIGAFSATDDVSAEPADWSAEM